jgi:hypothetical protein
VASAPICALGVHGAPGKPERRHDAAICRCLGTLTRTVAAVRGSSRVPSSAEPAGGGGGRAGNRP